MFFARRAAFSIGLILALGVGAEAQTVVSNVTALHNLVAGASTSVVLQGFHNPADGGGGLLASGTGATNSCDLKGNNGTTTSNSNQITNVNPFPVGVYLGMDITTNSLNIPVGTSITSFNPSNSTITLSATIGTGVANGTFTINGDNGGTIFKDAAGYCFYRASQTYSQAEWGAYGDYGSQNHDDTFALQNWMNAPQPHIAVPGNSMITAPLVCNDGGIIQGSPTAGVAEDPGILPTFVITAAPGTAPTPFAGQAMLVMSNAGGAGGANNARCAIHGVGLIASSPASGAGVYDTVDMLGTGDTIDQHSYLAGGYYNVKAAGEGTGQHNVEIYDSSLNNSVSDNLHIVSSNNKIVRNSFAGAGGNNIDFSGGGDTLISDNIIQQANGWGVSIHDSAIVVRIGTNLFDNDGKGIAGTGALQIKNSDNMTVCNNTFARSAAATEAGVPVPSQYAAPVYFSGIDDGVSLCGNVYRQSFNPPKQGALSTTYDAIMLRPDYDYDVGPGSTLTNVVIADNPAPQNIGVCSPNALLVLNCPNTTQPPQNNLPAPSNLTGLTMANAGANVVSILPGAASDSTDSTTISLPSGCRVDLGHVGAGALDTGTLMPYTTYNFFAISGPGGANPNCIASASAAPSFANAGADYQLQTALMTTHNSEIAFNATQSGFAASNIPLAGMAVGDLITDPDFIWDSTPTTITSLQSFALNNLGATLGLNSETVAFDAGISLTGVAPGMEIAGLINGSNPATGIPVGTTITQVNPASCTAPCVALSQAASGGGAATIWISGQYTITLSQPALQSTTIGNTTTVTVYAGLYRMVGALYTDGNGNIVQFSQEGDTFYLVVPVVDVDSGGAPPQCIGPFKGQPVFCALSVPKGIKVEAFGRIVGGASTNQVLETGTDQIPGPTNSFPGTPAYSTQSSAPDTAFPFRSYTDTNGEIRIRATGAPAANVYEDTDGWVWRRAQ